MLAALAEHVDERRARRQRGEESVDVAEIFNRINARVTREAAFTMETVQIRRNDTSSRPRNVRGNGSDDAAQAVRNYMDNLGLLPPRMPESPVQLGYPTQQGQQQQVYAQQPLHQQQQQQTPYLHFSPVDQVPAMRTDHLNLHTNGTSLFDPMPTIMPSLPTTTACWWDGISGAASSQDYSDLNTFNFATNDAAWYGF